MNNVSRINADLPTSSDRLVTPETATRHAIKRSKAYISRLKKEIRAEEQRVALQVQQEQLSDKLEEMRRK